MRMLDLFCGRFGWSRAFAARGWRCVGVDLIAPPEIPAHCKFIQADILRMDISPVTRMFWHGNFNQLGPFDFICASSPCEQFSVHGMKHFHPNPPYPELGIKLFEHTRALCEASGVPYVMENVRAAQQFVGKAAHHCGPFYLWGSGVPPIMPQGIIKGMTREAMGFREFKGSPIWNRKHRLIASGSQSKERKEMTALNATIPPELANCVADYAERLLEQTISKQEVFGEGPIPSGQSSET
jgi:hypothetical protein